MVIREARKEDWSQIKLLLDQLGYTGTEDFLMQKVEDLLGREDHKIIVCEADNVVIAFISIHFLPFMGLKGDLALIDYFSVDENHRNKNIGSLLESKGVSLARERRCSRIQVHCNVKRAAANKFYQSKGYWEYPVYYRKDLTY